MLNSVEHEFFLQPQGQIAWELCIRLKAIFLRRDSCFLLFADEEDDDSESIATIVVPVVCVAIVIACLITVFIVLRYEL